MNQPWFEACSCCSKLTQLGWFQWKESFLEVCECYLYAVVPERQPRCYTGTNSTLRLMHNPSSSFYLLENEVFAGPYAETGSCIPMLFTAAVEISFFLSEKMKNGYVFHAVQKNPHFVLPCTPQTACPFPPPQIVTGTLNQ